MRKMACAKLLLSPLVRIRNVSKIMRQTPRSPGKYSYSVPLAPIVPVERLGNIQQYSGQDSITEINLSFINRELIIEQKNALKLKQDIQNSYLICQQHFSRLELIDRSVDTILSKLGCWVPIVI
ncbi:hypothetical protein SS50377_22831 [Spironucleus salmonicida]|uniref:Uncharacterized protein n=1 Tax=Spironucleus salmonicida TaxID=348837 RepID=V6M3M3_9EUKA|nr:hypothetical protein SS50377_22831 [Spironucleus salmonicida]|eukprot:EST47894.1 Hypothetical protein SS50377_fx033 [Spironucleus salmonicida]